MKEVSGINVYYARTEAEAGEIMDKLDVCRNCANFRRHTLFDGCCSYDPRHPFSVCNDDKCEEFYAADKLVDYWIGKLVQMMLDANGYNDFMRQLAFHEKNGTAEQFLNP